VKVTVSEIESIRTGTLEKHPLDSGEIQKMHLFFNNNKPTDLIMMISLGVNIFATCIPKTLQLQFFVADALESSKYITSDECLTHIKDVPKWRTHNHGTIYDKNQTFHRIELTRDKCIVKLRYHTPSLLVEGLVLEFNIVQ
jgi:hypothetical protein